MTNPNPASRRPRSGFTLVELAVVIVIIGVLAAFGVPRFIKSVERSKAAEAFEYLASIRTAQERYQAQYGTYAANVTDLDIKNSPPKYFSVPATFTASATTLQDSWTLTLTRTGSSAAMELIRSSSPRLVSIRPTVRLPRTRPTIPISTRSATERTLPQVGCCLLMG